MVATMTPHDLQEALREDAQLIDVRTPAEFGEIHVQGARNVPLDRLKVEDFDKDARYVVICRSGSRGKMACDKLLAGGVENVVNVEGGTVAWEQAGLPVKRGKKAVSLERQVRIAAGFLVFVGSVASIFNPYFIALPTFVGAGLMFAGITDTCAMGMLIAKMPWNQCSDEGTCSTT